MCCILFRSGKVNITGAKNRQELQAVLQQFHRLALPFDKKRLKKH